MKKFLSISLFTLAVFGFASLASAQELLTYNLYLGMKGNPQVTIMQNYLISQGYLAPTNNTGNFGPLTFAAVKTYQSENKIDSTGFVGPLTRASLNTAISNGNVGGSVTSTSGTYPLGCTSLTGFSSVTGFSCGATLQVQNVAQVSVTPVQISNVTSSTATLTSTYNAQATGYYSVRFEYTNDPTEFLKGTQSRIGQIILQGSSGTFSASMANLIAGQVYYVRAVVEGGAQGAVTSSIASFTPGSSTSGTSGGNITTGTIGTYQNMTTAVAGQAYVGTNTATSVNPTGAVISGVFDARGSDTSVYFQYWTGGSSISSTLPAPGGKASGTATYVLSGLMPNMLYQYRIAATNSYGVSYGSTMSFTTK